MTMTSLFFSTPYRKQLSRRARQLGVVASALLLSACSGLTQPYVELRGPDGSAVVPANPTFAEAQLVARNASTDFSSRLQDLETFDLATGTLLVGAGLAGVAFGLYDSHIDKIYGAGLAGGAAVAGRSFLPINTRKKVYIAGSGAISCAIASISLGGANNSDTPQPAGVAERLNTEEADTVPARGPLGRAADKLRSLIDGDGGEANRESSETGLTASAFALSKSAAALLQATKKSKNPSAEATGNFYSLSAKRLKDAQGTSRKSAIRLLQSVDAAIDTRGPRLVSATAAIINAVNTRIEQAAITPESSLEAALASVASLNESIEEDANSVLNDAAEEEDNAAETKERAELAAMMAPNDKDVATAAQVAVASAEEAENKAEEKGSIAEKILTLVKVSDACLAGLDAAGS